MCARHKAITRGRSPSTRRPSPFGARSATPCSSRMPSTTSAWPPSRAETSLVRVRRSRRRSGSRASWTRLLGWVLRSSCSASSTSPQATTDRRSTELGRPSPCTRASRMTALGLVAWSSSPAPPRKRACSRTRRATSARAKRCEAIKRPTHSSSLLFDRYVPQLEAAMGDQRFSELKAEGRNPRPERHAPGCLVGHRGVG